MFQKITIKSERLGPAQKHLLKLLYDGPIHVRIDGVREQWRREDNKINTMAIHGFSEFHIYPYSSLIEDFFPMKERAVEYSYVIIPDAKRSQLRHMIYALWERGLIVVFTRKVEKMEKGYRRVPHVFEKFKTNRGRSDKIYGLTLSTEGLLLCKSLFNNDEDITNSNRRDAT